MLHTGDSGRISIRRHSEIVVCEAHANSDNASTRMTAMHARRESVRVGNAHILSHEYYYWCWR